MNKRLSKGEKKINRTKENKEKEEMEGLSENTSSTVECELTSNRLDTRYWESVAGSPPTRNREHLGHKIDQ